MESDFQLESDRNPLRCQAPVSGGAGGCGALSSGGRAAQWGCRMGRPRQLRRAPGVDLPGCAGHGHLNHGGASPMLDSTFPGPHAGLHWTFARRSEEHTSLQSLMRISYAVFCLKKKKKKIHKMTNNNNQNIEQ